MHHLPLINAMIHQQQGFNFNFGYTKIWDYIIRRIRNGHPIFMKNRILDIPFQNPG